MSENHTSHLLTHRRRIIGGVAFFAMLPLVLGGLWLLPNGEGRYEGLTAEVRRGDLDIAINETGNLRSADQAVVTNRVEGRTTILWIVEEGEVVEEGDLLVELDSSDLEERLVNREINVQNAEAAYIRAQQELKVTKSRTRSEIAEAELAARFARLDLEQYSGEEGEYVQERDRLQSEIDIAREEMLRARQRHEDSQGLADQEFITSLELEGDRLAYQRSRVSLRLAEGRLQLLEDYSHNRKLEQLRSDVERADEQLERVVMRAHSDVVQAEANYKAREQEFQRQQEVQEHLRRQIELCRIVAPASGMVVYETSANPGRRGSREPLEAGQDVRQRQELIFLPSSEGMVAEVRLHESALRDVEVGMEARVRVDARPGEEFSGRVRRIAPLPDATSVWLNPDLTVYSTEIEVAASDLRTGMSCRVEVIVDELEDVLQVPIQSVVRHNGAHVAYVLDSRGSPQRRPVLIGRDNNRQIEIVSGLEEGERVLLAPPLPGMDDEDSEEMTRENGAPLAPVEAGDAV